MFTEKETYMLEITLLGNDEERRARLSMPGHFLMYEFALLEECERQI